MKNSLLLCAIMMLSFAGFSQTTFTINNETGGTITYGLQLTDQASGPCVPVASYSGTIAAGDFATVTGSGSQFIFRVGVGGGYVYYDPTCGVDAPGSYTFTFDDWNEVTIE